MEADAHVMDTLEAHKFSKFDIVLMYGAILAHFNEWNMLRLFASAAKALKDDGLVIIEEMDRINAIFGGGYKEIVIESGDPEKPYLTQP